MADRMASTSAEKGREGERRVPDGGGGYLDGSVAVGVEGGGEEVKGGGGVPSAGDEDDGGFWGGGRHCRGWSRGEVGWRSGSRWSSRPASF
jgi:hypothetical protein